MFVQIIDARTTMPLEEIAALRLDWESKTEGRRTLRHSILLQDRADTNHILIVAWLDRPQGGRSPSDTRQRAVRSDHRSPGRT
jgi:hypothetical protein